MSLNVTGRYLKVWGSEESEYGKRVTLGSSRKDKEGNYINTNWFGVKFVGKAKEFGESIHKGDVIRVDSALIENVYKKETGKTFFNLTVFEARTEGDEDTQHKPMPTASEQEVESEDFPF